MNNVINEYTEQPEPQMIDLDNGSESPSPPPQSDTQKKETPLKNNNNKDKGKSKSGWLKENWHYPLLGGLALFVGLVFFNPFKSAPVSQERNTFEATEIIDEQRSADVQNEVMGKTEVLSQIVLTQKQKIETLEKENIVLKEAITQNRRDIEVLKVRYDSLKSPSQSTGAVPVSKVSSLNAPVNVLLTNMKINNLDQNIAWVNFKGRVYALQTGDKLNNVTVIAIDPVQRVVITDKGLIK